jgi:hypothetical protein
MQLPSLAMYTAGGPAREAVCTPSPRARIQGKPTVIVGDCLDRLVR